MRGKLCQVLQPYPAVQGEEIYSEGDIGRELFVIVHGTIAVWKDSEETRQAHSDRPERFKVCELVGGDFFGESPFVSNNPHRDRSVTALTNSDLSVMALENIKKLTRQYPELKARLHDFARRKLKLERRMHGAKITASTPKKKPKSLSTITALQKRLAVNMPTSTPPVDTADCQSIAAMHALLTAYIQRSEEQHDKVLSQFKLTRKRLAELENT